MRPICGSCEAPVGETCEYCVLGYDVVFLRMPGKVSIDQCDDPRSGHDRNKKYRVTESGRIGDESLTLRPLVRIVAAMQPGSGLLSHDEVSP